MHRGSNKQIGGSELKLINSLSFVFTSPIMRIWHNLPTTWKYVKRRFCLHETGTTLVTFLYGGKLSSADFGNSLIIWLHFSMAVIFNHVPCPVIYFYSLTNYLCGTNHCTVEIAVVHLMRTLYVVRFFSYRFCYFLRWFRKFFTSLRYDSG
jgi:hypothetical protein